MILSTLCGKDIAISIGKTKGIFPFNFSTQDIYIQDKRNKNTVKINDIQCKFNILTLRISYAKINKVNVKKEYIDYVNIINVIRLITNARIHRLYLDEFTIRNYTVKDIKMHINKKRSSFASCKLGTTPIKIIGDLGNTISLMIYIGHNKHKPIQVLADKNISNISLKTNHFNASCHIDLSQLYGYIDTKNTRTAYQININNSITSIKINSNKMNIALEYDKNNNITQIQKCNLYGILDVDKCMLKNGKTNEIQARIKNKPCILIKNINLANIHSLFEAINIKDLNLKDLSKDMDGIINCNITHDKNIILDCKSKKINYKNKSIEDCKISGIYSPDKLETNIEATILNRPFKLNAKIDCNRWIINSKSNVQIASKGNIDISQISSNKKIILKSSYDVSCRGPLNNIRYYGWAKCTEFKFIDTKTNIFLAEGKFDAKLMDKNLVLENFIIKDIKTKNGYITMQGSIDLDALYSNLHVKIENFTPYITKQLSYMLGGRISISGSYSDTINVSGDVNISNLSYKNITSFAINKNISENIASYLNSIPILKKTCLNINIHGDKLNIYDYNSHFEVGELVLPKNVFNTTWKLSSTNITGFASDPVINLSASLQNGYINIYDKKHDFVFGDIKIKNAKLRNFDDITFAMKIDHKTNKVPCTIILELDKINKKINIYSQPIMDQRDIICLLLFKKMYSETKSSINEYQALLSIIRNIQNRYYSLGVITEILNNLKIEKDSNINKYSISLSKDIGTLNTGIVYHTKHTQDGQQDHEAELKITKNITENNNVGLACIFGKNKKIGAHLEWNYRF